MSISLTSSLNQRIGANATGDNGPVVKPNSAKDAAKNEKAARDFEAILLTPVLDSLQKTFGGDPEEVKTPGASDYRHMATQALTQAIAERGGIGIAQMILRHLQPPKISSED